MNPQQPGWKTYRNTNQRVGIEIDIPADWKLREDEGEFGVAIDLSTAGDATIVFAQYLPISAGDYEHFDEWARQNAGRRKTKAKRFVVSGLEAARVSRDAALVGKQRYRQVEVFIAVPDPPSPKRGGHVYRFALSAPTVHPRLAQLLAIYETMLVSLRIIVKDK